MSNYNELLGTIHKRDFGSGETWYFLPILSVDLFFGILIPNDESIKANSYTICENIENNFELTENDTYYADRLSSETVVLTRHYDNGIENEED